MTATKLGQIVTVLHRIMTRTELAAAIAIARNSPEDETCFIAKDLADEKGIGRSSMVSALRKLNAADLGDSRSMGTRGTWNKFRPGVRAALLVLGGEDVHEKAFTQKRPVAR